MNIPRHWAEARSQHRDKGRQVTVRRFGWSATSPAEAERMAQDRVAEALQKILGGAKLARFEPKVAYNGADGMPIREEIVAEHGDCVITRNSYGALCLNTPDVLFADVDFEDRAEGKYGCLLILALVAGAILGARLTDSVAVGIAGMIGGCVLVPWWLAKGLPWWRRRRGGPDRRAQRRITDFMAAHPTWKLRLYRTPALNGLDEPWGLAFLPDGAILVTERAGRLLLASGGKAQAVSGVPDVRAAGQGGLLDVLVPRDFSASREVWLAYAVGGSGSGGAATAIGKGRLGADNRSLEGFRTLWTGDKASGGRHFGARLAEAPDGTIWLGTGDRGTGPDGMAAQEPGSTIGKVLAFRRDGTPLPAARPGWAPGVQSIGHRNIQGMTFDARGRLWASEHGARGGDEVNRIEPGRNYGWPAISYGTDYDGSKIGTGTAAPGLEQPQHVWDPSMAPSGLAAHDGSLVPAWRGQLFAGSLKFDHIARLDPAKGWAEEILQSPETGRVRDVRQGPDGAIWFLSVTEGALFRMAPATP